MRDPPIREGEPNRDPRGFDLQAGFPDSDDCWLAPLVLLKVDKLAGISSFQYKPSDGQVPAIGELETFV